MREIKFRVWHKTASRMLEWEVVESSPFPFENMKKEHLVFMQYTGLQDRNGKEIFVGDIITDGSVTGPCDGIMGLLVPTRYVVEFLNGCFVVKCPGCMNDHIFENYHLLWELGCDSEVEVVGNVFQNSYLLGAESYE